MNWPTSTEVEYLTYNQNAGSGLKHGDNDLDWLALAEQYIYETYAYDGAAMIMSPYELASRSPTIFRFMYAHVLQGGHDARAKAARRTDRDLRGSGDPGASRTDVDDQADVGGPRAGPSREDGETEPLDARVGESLTVTLAAREGKPLRWQDESGFVDDQTTPGVTAQVPAGLMGC